MTTRDLTSSKLVPAPITMVRGDRKVDVTNVLIHSDCRAMAIGARSQAARTYLEKFLNDLRVPSFPAEVHVSYN